MFKHPSLVYNWSCPQVSLLSNMLDRMDLRNNDYLATGSYCPVMHGHTGHAPPQICGTRTNIRSGYRVPVLLPGYRFFPPDTGSSSMATISSYQIPVVFPGYRFFFPDTGFPQIHILTRYRFSPDTGFPQIPVFPRCRFFFPDTGFSSQIPVLFPGHRFIFHGSCFPLITITTQYAINL